MIKAQGHYRYSLSFVFSIEFKQSQLAWKVLHSTGTLCHSVSLSLSLSLSLFNIKASK